jgi:hypothetical protein
MKIRFQDILNLKTYNLMLNPFTVNLDKVDIIYQAELLELKYDAESKDIFNISRSQKFWRNKKMPGLYPKMWDTMKDILIPFPSSYLVESGFSVVNNIMTKQRNRLKITERGDRRLFLTKIKPDIKYLVTQHQAQGSH